MAVNISVQQLRDPGLVPNLRRVLERYKVPASRIELEVKEAALTDPESQECINELARLGVGLALDDFGTGLTALDNLRRYPVHAVKIDRSFIEEVAVNPAAAALASTIIVMAHARRQEGDRRRRGDRRAAGVPARARLRRRAGLLPGASAARRSHDGHARRELIRLADDVMQATGA